MWLYRMTDGVEGDGPNVGANDGAHLLKLTNTPYRDFRPSTQLAMALFANKRAYCVQGSWDHPLHWLGLALPHEVVSSAESFQADDGGFAILRQTSAWVMLRYPRFRFRPSHADGLHLDFWCKGENLLRDTGTYSYNTEPKWMNYFGATCSHNTIQFDGREQMPRIGRFLLGDWLKTERVEDLLEDESTVSFVASYLDRHGASHLRRVHLGETQLRVEDEVAGFKHKAVLRWHLAPGHWRLEGEQLTDGIQILTVQGSMPLVRKELLEVWESRHYLEKTALLVLEVEVGVAGILTTNYQWTV
jgi:hypothetical protein